MVEGAHETDPIARFRAALETIGEQSVFTFPEEHVPTRFRRASVLMLFAPHEGSMSLVMTRRTSRVPTHAGEVCFPGGRIEDGEDPIAAALREANEEIGLDAARVRIHGRLDDSWAFGGYTVVPIVASAESMPRFERISEEVDAVLVERIDHLFDEAALAIEPYVHRGLEYRNSTIALRDPDVLFGVSSDLLLEVKDRVERGTTERGRHRLEELRMTVAAGIRVGE